MRLENRYNGLLVKLLLGLLVVLVLPAVSILWGGLMAQALVIPATPAMIAHLLVAGVLTAQRRAEVGRALAQLRGPCEHKSWHWTPIQWGSFAVGRRAHLASAALALGGAHAAATLSLILIAWEHRLATLPWGAALSLSALAGLVIGGFYGALLLGRYAPLDREAPTSVLLTRFAVFFNGDALTLASKTTVIAAIETRLGPPAWLVLHLQRDQRLWKVALPVPDEELPTLQDTAHWLAPPTSGSKP